MFSGLGSGMVKAAFSSWLGVVEAASSSLVTQTKIGGSTEPPIFFYFLAKSLEISCFRDIINGLVLPCFEGGTSPFFAFDHMFDHLRRFFPCLWDIFQLSLLFFYIFDFNFVNSKNQIIKSSFHLFGVTEIKNDRHCIELLIAFLIIHLTNNIFRFI